MHRHHWAPCGEQVPSKSQLDADSPTQKKLLIWFRIWHDVEFYIYIFFFSVPLWLCVVPCKEQFHFRIQLISSLQFVGLNSLQVHIRFSHKIIELHHEHKVCPIDCSFLLFWHFICIMAYLSFSVHQWIFLCKVRHALFHLWKMCFFSWVLHVRFAYFIKSCTTIQNVSRKLKCTFKRQNMTRKTNNNICFLHRVR